MPSFDSTGDKNPAAKTVLGLIVLTALWVVTALVDGPLLVKLALVGQRSEAIVRECTADNGQTCTAQLADGKTGQLRNSLLASYRAGATVAVRTLDGDVTTMRSEGQLVRSAAMRLLAAFVLATMWLRQWAKSKLPPVAGAPAR